MRIKNLLIASLLVAAVACTSNKTAGPIKVKVPARPAGQENVIGLTVPAMDTVRVGFVGLGMRGSGAVPRFTYIPGVKIVALCDVLPENVERSQKTLEERGFPRAAEYSGDTEAYKQLCERDDIDLVYICTDWVHHIPVALYAMEHGKNVACEVPSATSLDEIWSVIDMSEKTRKHFMMLENCCYDFFELSCLSMAQAGVFGEILHVEGSYLHNLDPFWDEYWNNWRLDFNEKHKGDVYATHGLGPVAQVLNIHRGDRFKTLVAMETKAVNGPRNVEKRHGRKSEDFQNGDETSTMISTENGKTILIEHSESGVFAITLGCDRGNLEKCMKAVGKVIGRMQEDRLSDARLKAAKKQLLGQLSISSDNGETQCLSMGKSLVSFGGREGPYLQGQQ